MEYENFDVYYIAWGSPPQRLVAGPCLDHGKATRLAEELSERHPHTVVTKTITCRWDKQ